MRTNHIVSRGTRFHFVLRIPRDLQHHFPHRTIWRSLHTTNEKDAAIAAVSHGFHAQRVFMQLRSGMLTPDLEKRLVASFLLHGISRIEVQATGIDYAPPPPSSPLDKLFAAIRDAQRKVFLILDNHRVHHSKKVKAWLEQHQEQIKLCFLPSYSPELNPDEYLNGNLKQKIRSGVPARS